MADILAGIFLLLAIITLIAGFIGLIKPSIIKQDSRGKAFGKGMAAFLVLLSTLALASCSDSKSCDGGNGKDCSNIGIKHYKGEVVVQDYSKAIEFFKKACDLNDGEGCFSAGVMYGSGTGVEQDYSQAVKYYDKSCNSLNYGKACINLANMYNNANGVKQDTAYALKLHKKGCNLNDASGCLVVGFAYQDGVVEKDLTKAVSFFEKSCNLKNTEACNHVAKMYNAGKGIKQSYAKGFEYFEKSCNLDDGLGCLALAYAYKEGKHVDKNIFKTTEYLEKSCQLNYGKGCLLLGSVYFEGEGVKQDYPRAKELFGKACDLKEEKGCETYKKMNDPIFKMFEPDKKSTDTPSSERQKPIEPAKPKAAQEKTTSRKNIEAVITSLKKHYNIDAGNNDYEAGLDMETMCWNDRACQVFAKTVQIQATHRSVEALTSSRVTPQYYQEVCSAIMIALTGANKALIEQQIPQFFNYASQNGRSKWEMLGIEITVSPDSSGLLSCDFYKPK